MINSSLTRVRPVGALAPSQKCQVETKDVDQPILVLLNKYSEEVVM